MKPEDDEDRTRAILRHILTLWAGFRNDLQGALSLVDGGAQLLQDKELDDDTRELLGFVQTGVEQIALLSRETHEALHCFQEVHEEEQPVRIRTLLGDVVADVEPWYRERSIDFEHSAANELPNYIFVKARLLHAALCCLLKTCAAHSVDNRRCRSSRVVLEVGVGNGSIIVKATASGSTSEQVRDFQWLWPDMGLAELVRKLGSQLHIEDQAASGWTLWFELGGDVLTGDERQGQFREELNLMLDDLGIDRDPR